MNAWRKKIIKDNDGLTDGYYYQGEVGDSVDKLSLTLRNVNHVYRRGNFRRGNRLSSGNQAPSHYKVKCYTYKSTDHLIADYQKLNERYAKETKQNTKEYKGRKGKSLAGTWDDEKKSNKEGPENELANVCFMVTNNEVFYIPNIFSCDGFEDDPHKMLSSMYEEIKMMCIRKKYMKSSLKSLLKENSILIWGKKKLVDSIQLLKLEKDIF